MVNKNKVSVKKKNNSYTQLFQKMNKLIKDQKIVIKKNNIDRSYIFLFDFCKCLINKYKEMTKDNANPTATIICSPLNMGRFSIAGIITVNIRNNNDRMSSLLAFLFSNDFNIYNLRI